MFYDRFAFLCSQRDISPSRAAVEAGISKSLVTKWKTNKVKYPSADIAQKLATYFGLTVAELLDEESEKAPTPEGERHANVIKIASRDGSFVEKRLSDEQVKALWIIIDQMPEAEDL